MFKTSQVVYLVAVFFLMRHFKLFSMVEKTTKVKDKTYVLGFKFAAIYVGAQILEMMIDTVFKRFPGLNMPSLPNFNRPKIPLIEGHGDQCNLVALSETGQVDLTTPMVIDDCTPNAEGTGYANCACDPTNSDLFVVDPLTDGLTQCTPTELAVGICPGDTADLVARNAAGCCPHEAVSAFYLTQQVAWADHDNNTPSGAHATVGPGACTGGSDAAATTYAACTTAGGEWNRPAGWAAHLQGQGAHTIASGDPRPGVYGTGADAAHWQYTRPGSGGSVVEVEVGVPAVPTCEQTAAATDAGVACADLSSDQAACVAAACTYVP